jgi:hypothetical protein
VKSRARVPLLLPPLLLLLLLRAPLPYRLLTRRYCEAF